MDTFRQRFLDNLTTARTHLRRIAWINGDDYPTGPFCLIGCRSHQLPPRSVGDALVQAAPVTILHALNVQVLKYDDLILVYQSATQLVYEVCTTVSNALVDMLNYMLPLAILGGSFLAFSKLALGSCQRLFFPAEESRIVNLCTVAEGSEVLTAKVNTNRFMRWLKWFWFKLYNKTDPPVTKRVTLNVKALDFTHKGAMELDLHVANLGKVKSTIVGKLEATLGIGERFVPTILEARITRLAVFTTTPEEVLKGQVNPRASILQNLRMRLLQPGMLHLPAGEHPDCIIQRERFFPFFPGFLAHFKRLIVDPPAGIQYALHLCALGLARIESVLHYLGSHTEDYATLCVSCQIHKDAIRPLAKARGFLA